MVLFGKFMDKIDIIVPVKNEAKNIPFLVERIDQALVREKIKYTIIFVDDHSIDATREKILALSEKYPIRLHLKVGRSGKAFSVIEGAKLSQTDYFIMLDADLQYAPEAIPEMVQKAQSAKDFGVIIAHRKVYKGSFFRRLASRLNAFIFGRLLFGLKYDVQSGLKLVRREIIEHLDSSLLYPWAIDIPLLFTALELGYKIGSVDITFERRNKGQSKISFLRTAFEIAAGSLRLKLRRKKIYHLLPIKKNSMLGAGIAYQRKRFITHTTLPHHQSALVTFKTWQIFTLSFILGLLFYGVLENPQKTAIIVIAVLSVIYFLDVFFNLFLVLKSLHFPPEIEISKDELSKLKESQLPLYSILCPLYREAHLLPQFIKALNNLDYPKDKLEVLLLLEEDDKETITASQNMELPSYVRTLIAPHSLPKTKPKACNYGLAHARGEYIVIFDAEDIPDPFQLKKAFLAFQKTSPNVVCLQAKLNYYNPHHNLLTKLFTAEYSLWFDVILTGLQSIETAIPLGGTSNHFRKDALLKLGGWDPFNVTEDCDLGARLFKEGYKTAVIDSTTLEEANSRLKNWIRQRSRWIKGYIQTYFVHMRNPIRFANKHGIHSLIFQLVVGGKIAFMLINPFLWLATISYFTLYAIVGPTIESLYPATVFYIAVTSLVFGNFLCLYYYMIGCAKREHWSIIKYVFFVPFYWLGVSLAAGVALLQLIIKPHYWEKTHHGFHLKVKPQIVQSPRVVYRPLPSSGLLGGAALVIASIFANFFNFLYNAYLGRKMDVGEFGLLSLFGSLLYLTQVPFGALSLTVTHQSAYYLGRYKEIAKHFWDKVFNKSLGVSLIIAGLWLIATPVLMEFFNSDSIAPFLIFTPIWIVGLLSAVNNGFLSGNLKFVALALFLFIESLVKLVFAYVAVDAGFTQTVYAALPISITISLILTYLFIKRLPFTRESLERKTVSFPKRFFSTSIFTKISAVSFLSFDLILAKHFLSSSEAGYYALLSLTGKMIFFFGGLSSQFIMPLVSKKEGERKKSTDTFYLLLLGTSLVVLASYLLVGVFGYLTVPILFGDKVLPIIPYLPTYCLAIACFTVSTAIVFYHQAKRHYFFSLVSFLLALSQIGLFFVLNSSIEIFVEVMFALGVFHLFLMSFLHLFYSPISIVLTNLKDFFGLFGRVPQLSKLPTSSLKILIFNWRDTKHVWAGGAEKYIQEIAKRWVKEGHKITLFCGNDGKHPRNEVIDGVQIVRRGGFYTVYLWAFLYYVLRFRGIFDIIIDSENGLPFFTPLFVGKPKYLLIHHIHQEVFRKHLKFPFSFLAWFVEAKIMPILYKNQKIITVSASSKNEILKLGVWRPQDIEVINPGVDLKSFIKLFKTAYPSFLYLGRLKPYKNIDTLISSFANVLATKPKAKLFIAGEGESHKELKKLVFHLKIEDSVEFLGKIAEEEKAKLLGRVWVFVHPSMIEGWGITVIEANASGTPVIASNVAGLRDSVIHNKTGLLVPVRNVPALTAAMNVLISNPAYRVRLSKEAYNWAKKFSWERSTATFLKTIKNDLEDRRSYEVIPKLAVEISQKN